jgi:hypothetical protein
LDAMIALPRQEFRTSSQYTPDFCEEIAGKRAFLASANLVSENLAIIFFNGGQAHETPCLSHFRGIARVHHVDFS